MKTKQILDKYEINELGEIRNIKTGRVLEPSIHKQLGYPRVNIGGKVQYVHRLMAMAFLGLEKGDKRVVDHINNIKTDNRLENLQLLTTSENTKKYYKQKTEGTWINNRTEEQKEYSRNNHKTEGYKKYQREYKRNYYKERYANDEEFREKTKAYQRELYKKRKENLING